MTAFTAAQPTAPARRYAGSMNPPPGNSFEYPPIDFHDNVYDDVFERITFRTPFAK